MTLLAPPATSLGRLAGRGGGREALLAPCVARLRELGHSPDVPACAFFVPGRIEVLGKHTDYAGGRSLLCAVARGMVTVGVPRDDDVLRAADGRSGETVVATLSGPARPGARAPGRDGADRGAEAAGGDTGWSPYVHAVARRIGRDFPGPGADVAFASDLPPAAGMSSSSVLVVSLGLALGAASGRGADSSWSGRFSTREALADYLAAVETGRPWGDLPGDEGVGTRGGGEDPVAALCARPGALVRYSFRPTSLEGRVPLPAGHVFVVAVSGVRAAKTAGAQAAYNRASDQAALLERWLAEITGRDVPLARALEDEPGGLADLAGRVRAEDPEGASSLLARLEQLRAESVEIVPEAAAALGRGDLATFGHLVDRSQRLAEKGLGNQVPETVWLARAARERGAAASSAFGAGFGGSVWALVPEDETEGFTEALRAAYRETFPRAGARATFLVTGAAPAAARIA